MNNTTAAPSCNWASILNVISKDECAGEGAGSSRNSTSRKLDYGHGQAAGWYVIIVIIFYGTSVMFLIASHIKRKHEKILEDHQINGYLKEFQVVKEKSSLDNYRTLKRNTIAQLSRMGVRYGKEANEYSALYRCLSSSMIPITALAFSAESTNSIHSRNSASPMKKPLQSIEEGEEMLRNGEEYDEFDAGYPRGVSAFITFQNDNNLHGQHMVNEEDKKTGKTINSNFLSVPTSKPLTRPLAPIQRSFPNNVHKPSLLRPLSEGSHARTTQLIARTHPPSRTISSRGHQGNYAPLHIQHPPTHSETPRTPVLTKNIEKISSV